MKNTAILCFLSCLLSCSQKTQQAKLIIIISVDQMRADYVDRFGPHFKGGLKTLLEKGAVFTNVEHFHAFTETAPGHAVLSTGAYPCNNGISENQHYNPFTHHSEYCVEDSQAILLGKHRNSRNKVSHKNLLMPAIGDIVKTHDPLSKSYSISFKDRAAILMAGKNANAAYWFDEQYLGFISNNTYSDSFPEWIGKFRADSVLSSEFETGWHLEKNFPFENIPDKNPLEEGDFSSVFPHRLSDLDSAFPDSLKKGYFLYLTPFGDRFVMEFAKELIRKQGLGADNHPDVLSLSLSSSDWIGHQFGPHSREVADYYLKLDILLVDFMQYLDRQIGKNNYHLVLSSDHGVAPFPEDNKEGQRISRQDFKNTIARIDSNIRILHGVEAPFLRNTGIHGLVLNFSGTKNVDSSVLLQQFSDSLKALSYIAETYTRRDMEDISIEKSYIPYFRNSYSPLSFPTLAYLPEKNCLVMHGPTGTDHRTPYDYDTKIPLIFYGFPSYKNLNLNAEIKSSQLVPTLLDMLGIKTDQLFDGKSAMGS